jgi:hypothetical protein
MQLEEGESPLGLDLLDQIQLALWLQQFVKICRAKIWFSADINKEGPLSPIILLL